MTRQLVPIDNVVKAFGEGRSAGEKLHFYEKLSLEEDGRRRFSTSHNQLSRGSWDAQKIDSDGDVEVFG